MSEWWFNRRVTRAEFDDLSERVDQMAQDQAQNQAEIDADFQNLQAGIQTVQVEVDALKAGQATGQTLDFSKLETAVAEVGKIVPTPPLAPPVPPAPAP